MAEWMKKVIKHGADADIGGRLGEWLEQVRRADGDPVETWEIVSPDADRRQAESLGASESLLMMMEGYPDPHAEAPHGYSGPMLGMADPGMMLAWEAARHHILVDTLAEGHEIPLPGQVTEPGFMLTIPTGGEDGTPAPVGMDGMYRNVNLCDMIEAYAINADNPAQAIIDIGWPAYAMIYRYAKSVHNKSTYGLNGQKIIRLAEQCARENGDMITVLLTILEKVNNGEWDDIIPIDMDVIRDLAALPESFVMESMKGIAGIPEAWEYSDMLQDDVERMTKRYGIGPRIDVINNLKAGLESVNPRKRVKALALMDQIDDSYGMIDRMFADDLIGYERFMRCRNETIGKTMNRIKFILNHGEDGLLRWAVLSDVSATIGFSDTLSWESYGCYVEDGTIPDSLMQHVAGMPRRIIKVDDRLCGILEGMPTTMDAFHDLTRPNGKYAGCNVRRMVLRSCKGYDIRQMVFPYNRNRSQQS